MEHQENPKELIEFLQSQIQILLMATGDEVPDGMVNKLLKDGDDPESVHRFRYEFKEFYDDLMDGGVEGFKKHYEVEAIDNKEIKGKYKGFISALSVKPKDKLSLAIMAGISSLAEKINDDIEEFGMSPENNGGSKVSNKPDKYEGVELTAEVRRDIEFNIGEDND
jgi:regulator of RNase E activity RraB